MFYTFIWWAISLSLCYYLIGYVSSAPKVQPPLHYKSSPLIHTFTVPQTGDSPALTHLIHTLRFPWWRHPPRKSNLWRPLAGLRGTPPATSHLSNSPEGSYRLLYICPSYSPVASSIYVPAVCLALSKWIVLFVFVGQRERRMSPSRFCIAGYATLTSIALRTNGEMLSTPWSPGK